MARATWTYEVAPWRSDQKGLDGYAVEAASGAGVGKVASVVRRGDEVYVVVERGAPPLRSDRRAVPWDDVKAVDHVAAAVRLRLSKDEVASALELDPGKGIVGREAEAVRVSELPGDLAPPVSPDAPGPVARPLHLAALALALAGFFSLLLAVVVAAIADAPWRFVLFALPLVFFALAFLAGYRVYHHPQHRGFDREPRRTRGKPSPRDRRDRRPLAEEDRR